jgi:type I restriction enzyme S subunit
MAEELFINEITNEDKLYRFYRDEDRVSELKSYMENLWKIYCPYADRDFRQQLTQDFHARFWEMYLTCTLVNKSFNVVSKQTRAKGPDIKIDHASTTIWVEAVLPTSGDPSKPDSVPNLQIGVAQQVPDDQIILRYRNAIDDKYFNKYRKYLQDIITDKDCYVIALNGCKIRHGDREPPRIVRSVLTHRLGSDHC